MAIRVFVDESGTKGQDVAFVFAGLMARAKEWAAFSDEWRFWLSQSPAIRRFKMTEAVGLNGDFRRMSESERNDKVRQLARTINKLAPRVSYVALDIEAAAELYPMMGKGHPWFGQPYFWAFHAMVMSVAFDLEEAGETDRFEIVFDEQEVFGPRAMKYYPHIRAIMSIQHPAAAALLPIQPIFRDDEQFMPLQAADMFAWSLRRVHNGDPPGDCDFVFNEFKKVTLSSHYQILDRERIEKQIDLVDEIDDELLKEMARRMSGEGAE